MTSYVNPATTLNLQGPITGFYQMTPEELRRKMLSNPPVQTTEPVSGPNGNTVQKIKLTNGDDVAVVKNGNGEVIAAAGKEPENKFAPLVMLAGLAWLLIGS